MMIDSIYDTIHQTVNYMKKETTQVVMTEIGKSNIVLKDGYLSITPSEGHSHQGVALHVISSTELVTHRVLKDGKYYYIKNHYSEWYVGKYNEKEFEFVDDKGTFSPMSIDNCYEVLASTVKDIPSNNVIPKHSIRRFVQAFNNKTFEFDAHNFPKGLLDMGIDLIYLSYK